MNYFEHHIGDYDSATAHLTACEDGIYCRLIRLIYARERPLPAEKKSVVRLARARTREERTAVDTVLGEFFFLTDDGWHNARCDEEIQRYSSRRDKAKTSSRLGVEARKAHANANRTVTERLPIGDRPTTERLPPRARSINQSPDTSNQDPDLDPDPDPSLNLPVIREGESEGKGSDPPPTARRGTRLADDWCPDDDLLAWTHAEQPTWTPSYLLLKLAEFRDYWRGIAGQRGCKLDWPATWRNRVRGLGPMPAALNGHGKPHTNGGAVAGVFTVAGQQHLVHVNRNGEYDSEHVGFAGMLEITSRGKTRPELQQKILEKFTSLQARTP